MDSSDSKDYAPSAVDVCSPEKEVYGVSGEIVFSGNYSRSHDVGNCVKSIQVVAEKVVARVLPCYALLSYTRATT